MRVLEAPRMLQFPAFPLGASNRPLLIMSSFAEVAVSSPPTRAHRPRSDATTPRNESTPAPEGRPKMSQIVLTALSGAIGLGSATGSYHFGINNEREKHPLYLVFGYCILTQ